MQGARYLEFQIQSERKPRRQGVWVEESAPGPSTPPVIGGGSGLAEELIDYHAQYKPIVRADLIFDIIEGAENHKLIAPQSFPWGTATAAVRTGQSATQKY